MAIRHVSEAEMRAVVLKAALPAWTSVVLLALLFRGLSLPAYISLGACIFIALTIQSVLQARVFPGPRPVRYWIFSGVIAMVGAIASAWIDFRA
jgi:hypothetical protein